MKFYNDKINSYYWSIIFDNKLSTIHCDYYGIRFYKNAMDHNTKNAAYIRHDGYKQFWLNGKYYGNEDDFTKKSWRKFVKLQVFK